MDIELIHLKSTNKYNILGKKNKSFLSTLIPMIYKKQILYIGCKNNIFFQNNKLESDKLNFKIIKYPFWNNLIILKSIEKYKPSNYIKIKNILKSIPKKSETMNLIIFNGKFNSKINIKYLGIENNLHLYSYLNNLFLKFKINQDFYPETYIIGSPIFKNNKLIGVLNDIEDDIITIIPSIYIFKTLQKKYNNYIPSIPIFVDFNKNNKLFLLEDYERLQKNDILLKIDDYCVNPVGKIYYNRINQYIDISTYIVLEYENKIKEDVKITIERNKEKIEIYQKITDLNHMLTFKYNPNIKCINKGINERLIKITYNLISYLIENDIKISEDLINLIPTKIFSHDNIYFVNDKKIIKPDNKFKII